MRKRFWILPAALAAMLAGCGGGNAPAEKERQAGQAPAAQAKPLVVGMEMSYPPFEMTGTDGRPAGLSVDLAEALAKHLGRPLELENIQFSGLIPALQSGRVDMIISSMTATEKRAESVAFSDPYLKTGLAMLVPKDSLVEGVEDLNSPGKKVVVKRGTTGQTFSVAHLPEAKIMVLERADTAVLEVAQGRADAFVYDQMSIDQYARRNPETTRPVLEAINTEEWAIAMRQSDDQLRGQVNAFLKEFAASGGFDRLGDKYLKEFKESFEARGIPFVF